MSLFGNFKTENSQNTLSSLFPQSGLTTMSNTTSPGIASLFSSESKNPSPLIRNEKTPPLLTNQPEGSSKFTSTQASQNIQEESKAQVLPQDKQVSKDLYNKNDAVSNNTQLSENTISQSATHIENKPQNQVSGGFYYELNKMRLLDEIVKAFERCNVSYPENLLDNTLFSEKLFQFFKAFNIELPTENIPKLRVIEESQVNNMNTFHHPNQIPNPYLWGPSFYPQFCPCPHVANPGPFQTLKSSEISKTEEKISSNELKNRSSETQDSKNSDEIIGSLKVTNDEKSEAQKSEQNLLNVIKNSTKESISLQKSQNPFVISSSQSETQIPSESPKKQLIHETTGIKENIFTVNTQKESTTTENKPLNPSNDSGVGGLMGGTTSTLFGSATQTSNEKPTTPLTGGSLGSNTTTNNASTGGLFGESNTLSSGTTNQVQSTGLFGQGGGLLGNNTTNGSTGGLFGNTGTSGGLFGAGGLTTPGTQPSGGLFGGGGLANPGTQPSGGLFGGGGLANSGAQPTGGLFGSTQNTGGLFTSTQTTGGLFGGSKPLGGGLFGAGTSASLTTQSGGGLLGSQNSGGGPFEKNSKPAEPEKGQATEGKPFLSEEELLELLKAGDHPPSIEEKYDDDDDITEVKDLINYKYEDNIKLEVTTTPINKEAESQDVSLLISIHTKEISIPKNQHRPMDVVFLVDTSGSLRNGRLDSVKTALKKLLPEFSENDRISIVGFSEEAKRYCRLTKNQKVVEEAIDKLEAEGITNLESGLIHSFEVLLQRRKANPVSSIVIISDGLDFSGRDFYDTYKYYREKIRDGFLIQTIGTGEDHDPLVCIPVAGMTHGDYYPCPQYDELYPVLLKSVNDLKCIIGKYPTIEFNPQRPDGNEEGFEIEILNQIGGEQLWMIKDDDNKQPWTKGQYLIAGKTYEYGLQLKVKPNESSLNAPTLCIGTATFKISPFNPSLPEFPTFVYAKLIFEDTILSEAEKENVARTIKKSFEDDLMAAAEHALGYNFVEGRDIIQKIQEKIKEQKLQDSKTLLSFSKDLEELLQGWDHFKFFEKARYVLGRLLRKDYIVSF